MYEWETMIEGEEIDKIVAERVGWDPKLGYWWYVQSKQEEGMNTLKSSPYPKYSEDWRATGKLIEYAEKTGMSLQIKLLSVGTYEVCMMKENIKRRYVQKADTLPLAIVKSFLKATETRDSNLDIC